MGRCQPQAWSPQTLTSPAAGGSWGHFPGQVEDRKPALPRRQAPPAHLPAGSGLEPQPGPTCSRGVCRPHTLC